MRQRPRAQTGASDWDPRRYSPAEFSAPRVVVDECLRPDKLRPCHLRRVSRRCGNAKASCWLRVLCSIIAGRLRDKKENATKRKTAISLSPAILRAAFHLFKATVQFNMTVGGAALVSPINVPITNPTLFGLVIIALSQLTLLLATNSLRQEMPTFSQLACGALPRHQLLMC